MRLINELSSVCFSLLFIFLFGCASDQCRKNDFAENLSALDKKLLTAASEEYIKISGVKEDVKWKIYKKNSPNKFYYFLTLTPALEKTYLATEKTKYSFAVEIPDGKSINGSVTIKCPYVLYIHDNATIGGEDVDSRGGSGFVEFVIKDENVLSVRYLIEGSSIN